MKSLSLGQEIKCLSDQWLNPIFIEDILQVLNLAIDAKIRGTFHLGTKTIFTRIELARYLARAFGFDGQFIQEIKMKDLQFSEPRPHYNTLDCAKAEKTFNFKFTEIAEALPELRSLVP